MKQVQASVVDIVEVNSGIHLVRIESPEIAREAQPGQFVTVRCGNDILLRRPLSIHRIGDGKVSLLFSVVGSGTEWLANRATGESLDILGPLGNGFRIDRQSTKVLLVAGGIGIAPLVYLAENAVTDGLSVKLLIGTATASQQNIEVDGVEVMRVTEDGSLGEKGMVTDLLPSLAEWADQVFACGPIPMYHTMSKMGTGNKDKQVQILLEQVMGCGVGACRGCAITTHKGMKMVCQDGPVFELSEIVWEQITAPNVGRI